MMSLAAGRRDRRAIRPAIELMDRNAASGAVRGVRLSRMIALLVVSGAIWGASIAAGRCDAVADLLCDQLAVNNMRRHSLFRLSRHLVLLQANVKSCTSIIQAVPHPQK